MLIPAVVGVLVEKLAIEPVKGAETVTLIIITIGASLVIRGLVQVWVEDQGPGIALSERELVFQAFYQGSAPARGNLKSSGLGLAIVQEYVNANRGIIEVGSCDTGALFRVIFPLQAD